MMAGRGVARAWVELLLAVSMVTGSHGACLVQPVSVSRGVVVQGLAGILSEFLVIGYMEEALFSLSPCSIQAKCLPD